MMMQPVSVEMKPVYGDAASDVHAICVYGSSCAVCVLGDADCDDHVACVYDATVIKCSLCLW